jgi:hypothetical protein
VKRGYVTTKDLAHIQMADEPAEVVDIIEEWTSKSDILPSPEKDGRPPGRA